MYQLALDMGLVDFAITRAIAELSQERDRFSAGDIAIHIGCGVATVKRNLPRLRKSGVIIRIGSKRAGYRYEFVRERYARSG